MEPGQGSSMTIGEKDGKALLLLRGTIDIFSADELYQAAQSLLERGEDTLICCQEAERLDSCAIQILLSLKNGLKEKGKTLQMNAVSPGVEKIFSVAGLNGYFS